jgi:hypothetical protein
VEEVVTVAVEVVVVKLVMVGVMEEVTLIVAVAETVDVAVVVLRGRKQTD